MKMVDKEQTCFFHWIQSFDRHSKQLITHEFHDQHKAFCYDYKKPCPWKKLTFNMLPFNCGGIHLELLARALFKGSKIGLASCTFMCNNGKASCWT
jgi:hypothetical protein